ncbi:MAG: 6-phosphogluconolactonase, partial [Anaerolineales bacterium]
MTEIHRFDTPGQLADSMAAFLMDRTEEAIEARGSFSIALAGGTTPKPIYSSWSAMLLASEVDPTDLHIFWGDERCVPPDDPMSNFRMAYNTLLSEVHVPDDQVHAVRCEQNPKEAAAAYEQVLREHFEGGEPRFDVVLL